MESRLIENGMQKEGDKCMIRGYLASSLLNLKFGNCKILSLRFPQLLNNFFETVCFDMHWREERKQVYLLMQGF